MRRLSRRLFLREAAFAAAAPALANYTPADRASGPMLSRAIPSTNEKLPVVGLGTWQQFDVNPGGPEVEQLLEVLKNVAGKGGKVIDSSPMYGRSEATVGSLTQASGLAESFFYATKVWTSGREEGIRQMEESMRRMKRRKMDLMQVHNLLDVQTHLKTLKHWKDENKIRYTGATHYSTSAHDELERLIKKEKLDFLQFNYNIRERNAEKRLINAARDNGVAVIINEPFDSGALFRQVREKTLPEWVSEWGIASWAQFFLKYILSHPGVTCVIPGTSNPRHALDNMSAGYGPLPDEAGRNKMAAFFDAL